MILLAAVPLGGQLKPVAPAAAGMSAAGLEAAAKLISDERLLSECKNFGWLTFAQGPQPILPNGRHA